MPSGGLVDRRGGGGWWLRADEGVFEEPWFVVEYVRDAGVGRHPICELGFACVGEGNVPNALVMQSCVGSDGQKFIAVLHRVRRERRSWTCRWSTSS